MTELTDRQEQIADLLLAGAEMRSICQRLHITHGCLKKHLSDMRARLGVATQTELTALLRERVRNPLPAVLEACRQHPRQWWSV